MQLSNFILFYRDTIEEEECLSRKEENIYRLTPIWIAVGYQGNPGYIPLSHRINTLQMSPVHTLTQVDGRRMQTHLLDIPQTHVHVTGKA